MKVQSLTAAFCGLSLSGQQEKEKEEEEEEEEEEARILLKESFAHKLAAYSQAHTLFRWGDSL